MTTSRTARTKKRRVITYARDAVLRVEQVADGLSVSVRTVERMDLPTIYLAGHTKRYLWGQVLDALASRVT